MNWWILGFVGLVIIAIVIVTLRRNKKEEKDLENEIKFGFRKKRKS